MGQKRFGLIVVSDRVLSFKQYKQLWPLKQEKNELMAHRLSGMPIETDVVDPVTGAIHKLSGNALAAPAGCTF